MGAGKPQQVYGQIHDGRTTQLSCRFFFVSEKAVSSITLGNNIWSSGELKRKPMRSRMASADFDTGQVVLKAEKTACRAFPDPKGDGIVSGPMRNFQVLGPLDFIAEFTQHPPSPRLR